MLDLAEVFYDPFGTNGVSRVIFNNLDRENTSFSNVLELSYNKCSIWQKCPETLLQQILQLTKVFCDPSGTNVTLRTMFANLSKESTTFGNIVRFSWDKPIKDVRQTSKKICFF